MKTGAVIVTYNSADYAPAAVESCLRQGIEVVVVDNASTDDTVTRLQSLPGLSIIANVTNAGFAGGVNQGFAALRADLVLILNPDAELTSPITPLAEACAEHGAAAGLLTDRAGVPQSGFAIKRLPTPAALAFEVLGLNRLWPSNPVNRHYRCHHFDLSKPGIAEQPAGAFLMVRKDAWRQVGGFDEAFHPVWFDDVDFCKRLGEAGIRIQYVPASVAQHTGGHSVNRLAHARRARYWYASLIRYSAKHFGSPGRMLVCAAVIVASIPRAFVAVVTERTVEPVSAYFAVVRIAGIHLFNGYKKTTKGFEPK